MIVMLHGVPETPSVWAPLRARLAERALPSQVLELPGFVSAAPEGFASTKEAYADWLVGQLQSYDEPVDLVSHDWGSPLTLWVAAHRPELLRSWVADGTYMLHEDYTWHTLARVPTLHMSLSYLLVRPAEHAYMQDIKGDALIDRA